MTGKPWTRQWKMKGWAVLCALFLGGILAPPACFADWRPHAVRQFNGQAEQMQLPAQIQVVTESWNELVRAPYLIYMPEKERLAMLVNRGAPLAPLHAAIVTSDDGGATWGTPRWTRTDAEGKPNSGVKHGLTYLGEGKLLFAYSTCWRWRSADYGETWQRILHHWVGHIKGPNSWCAGSPGTSSVLLPDGWFLTAYGTGYRAKFPPSGPPGNPTPRDIALVRRRPNEEALSDDRTIRDAPFDSDLRNVIDPAF